MKAAIVSLLLVFVSTVSADQIATTYDGKKVILKDDGTWQYAAEGRENPNDEYANGKTIISKHCETKWATDFRMRAYCEDQQKEALETLKKGSPKDIPRSDYTSIHKACRDKWTDDFRMQAYCENQQFEAFRKLQKD